MFPTALTEEERQSCRRWRKSVPYDQHRLGIYPQLNAVTLLNDTAAMIWDDLAGRQDIEHTIQKTREDLAISEPLASTLVGDLLGAWRSAGFLSLAAPDEPVVEDRTPYTGPWHFDRVFRFGEGAICIRIADERLANAMAGILANVQQSSRTADTTVNAWADARGAFAHAIDGRVIATDQTLLKVRASILGAVLKACGPEQWLARLHCACVSKGEETLLIVGPSGSGKSTLAAALRARGWTQLSDDVAVMDDELNVHPIPFAASIKAGAVNALMPDFADLSHGPLHVFGERTVRYLPLAQHNAHATPRRPTKVLRVRYASGEPLDLVPLDPLAALTMFVNDDSFINFEHPASGVLLKWISNLRMFSITYGDLHDVLSWLEKGPKRSRYTRIQPD